MIRRVDATRPMSLLSFLLASTTIHATLQGQTRSADSAAWVGAWAAAPQPAPPAGALRLANQTLRLIVRSSGSGKSVRIRLSNLYGDRALAIGSAHIARRVTNAAIDSASDRSLTFGGKVATAIPAGGLLVSDAISLDVAAGSDLAVSLFLPDSTAIGTIHSLARQTSYVSQAGDHAGDATLPIARMIRSWPLLCGLDVYGAEPRAAIVAFGHSQTDGDGSSLDSNRRYPDVLAVRLQQAGRADLTVLNLGIIGNRLLNDSPAAMREQVGALLGEAGVSRFERDVLSQPGVKYVILALGVNDILLPGAVIPPGVPETADDVIAGYLFLARRAHAHGVRIIATTIPPFEAAVFLSPPVQLASAEKEATRLRVNDWIRRSTDFDAIADFDAVLRDPGRPARLMPAFDAGDHLHLNDAGYAAMANAIALTFFSRP